MPETIVSTVLAVSSGQLSDDIISVIINAMALCGDSPIAQLATRIRDMRKGRVEIESDTSRLRYESYDRSLCEDLRVAMVREGIIDRGLLDLGKLRSCFRTK